MNNLAYLEHQAGEHERALTVIGRLQELIEQHEIGLNSHYLDTMARVYLEAGRFSEAEEVLSTMLTGDDAAADADGVAEFTLTLAEVQRRRGSTVDAAETLQRCRELCEQRSLNGVLVRVHQEQAELHAAEGRFEEAFAERKVFYEKAQQLRSDARVARARTLQSVFDYEQARRASERFEEMAYRDPLTELYNRRFVDRHLPALLGDAAGPTDLVSVAFIDLDHFKLINDTLSHLVGDEVLRRVADLLRGAAPEPSFVARMGGEEFLLVIPGTEHDKALRLVEELQDSIRGFDWSPVTGGVPVRASIGLATALACRCEQAQLLAIADRNVYEAKSNGRDQIVASNESGADQETSA